MAPLKVDRYFTAATRPPSSTPGPAMASFVHATAGARPDQPPAGGGGRRAWGRRLELRRDGESLTLLSWPEPVVGGGMVRDLMVREDGVPTAGKPPRCCESRATARGIAVRLRPTRNVRVSAPRAHRGDGSRRGRQLRQVVLQMHRNGARGDDQGARDLRVRRFVDQQSQDCSPPHVGAHRDFARAHHARKGDSRRHTLSASVTYMTSLMPRRISQTLAGQEVK